MLTNEQADYFTRVSGAAGSALVALDPAEPTAIIGVARYFRDPGTADAEYAIVVADDWQGKGLGLGLTRALVVVARAQSIRHFYAYVLPENRRMLNLFHDLPFVEHEGNADGVQRIEVDLLQLRPADSAIRAESE